MGSVSSSTEALLCTSFEHGNVKYAMVYGAMTTFNLPLCFLDRVMKDKGWRMIAETLTTR